MNRLSRLFHQVFRSIVFRRQAPRLVGGPRDTTPYVQQLTYAPDGAKNLEIIDRLSFEYRRGLRRGAEPCQAALDALLAKADRVRILDGGIWRDEAFGVDVLIDTRRRADLDSLRTALRLLEEPETFGHCAGLGSRAVEFYGGAELLATLGLHHGSMIRWSVWKHDVRLVDASSLCSWLTDRGIEPDPSANPEDPLGFGLLGLTRAERHVARGESYLRHGDLPHALEECERALRIDAEQASAYGLRGEVHRLSGRFQEAIADYDTSIARGLSIAAVYHGRAVARATLGEAESALADCDQAIELDPDYPSAYNARAQVRVSLGQLGAAMEDLGTAIRLAPDWLIPLVVRARTLLLVGRPEAALGDLNEVVQRLERSDDLGQGRRPGVPGPTLPGVLMLRGQTLDCLGAVEQARADFDRAIEFEPDDPGMRMGRGDFLASHGEFTEALIDFDELIQLRPDEAEGYCRRAIVRRLMGDLDEAVNDLGDALRWNPDNPAYYGLRGEINLQRQRYELAIEDFNRTIDLAPGISRAFAMRAQGLGRLGRYTQAREDLETALRLDPDDLGAANALAWLLATNPDDTLRDGPRAVALARKVVDRSAAQAPEPLDTLAAALAECGRFEEACEAQRQALERLQDPNRGDAYQSRLALYEEGRPCRGGE